MTKNWKKFIAEKKNLDQNYIYLSLCLYKGRPSFRKSLQLSKETSSTSQQEILNFFSTFGGPFWPGIRIRNPWPDWIRIQIGSGSETQVLKSGSETFWPGFDSGNLFPNVTFWYLCLFFLKEIFELRNGQTRPYCTRICQIKLWNVKKFGSWTKKNIPFSFH